jgi:hypothetical protein
VTVVVGLATGANLFGDELRYMVEKEGQTFKPRPSTVLLAKSINSARDEWQIGGAVLIAPRVLLTAKHNGVDGGFSYAFGPSFTEKYKAKAQTEGNIGKVIDHPDLDLSIIHLSHDAEGEPAQILTRPVGQSEGPLALAAVHSLQRKEVYAGVVDSLQEYDQYRNRHGAGTMLVANNPASAPGDSGGPLFLEDQDGLVGICSGQSSTLFGLAFKKSYYINVTHPDVRSWIVKNTSG